MADQPKRGPGRPRYNRIDSFNIDSFLRQNPKFIKFKRELQISEEKAWTILSSLFCFIAQNDAMTPKINDPNLLAEFCYYDDPPKLFSALTQAGFIQKDGTIVNWFEHQPHAKERLRKYQYRKKIQT